MIEYYYKVFFPKSILFDFFIKDRYILITYSNEKKTNKLVFNEYTKFCSFLTNNEICGIDISNSNSLSTTFLPNLNYDVKSKINCIQKKLIFFDLDFIDYNDICNNCNCFTIKDTEKMKYNEKFCENCGNFMILSMEVIIKFLEHFNNSSYYIQTSMNKGFHIYIMNKKIQKNYYNFLYMSKFFSIFDKDFLKFKLETNSNNVNNYNNNSMDYFNLSDYFSVYIFEKNHYYKTILEFIEKKIYSENQFSYLEHRNFKNFKLSYEILKNSNILCFRDKITGNIGYFNLLFKFINSNIKNIIKDFFGETRKFLTFKTDLSYSLSKGIKNEEKTFMLEIDEYNIIEVQLDIEKTYQNLLFFYFFPRIDYKILNEINHNIRAPFTFNKNKIITKKINLLQLVNYFSNKIDPIYVKSPNANIDTVFSIKEKKWKKYIFELEKMSILNQYLIIENIFTKENNNDDNIQANDIKLTIDMFIKRDDKISKKFKKTTQIFRFLLNYYKSKKIRNEYLIRNSIENKFFEFLRERINN